VKSRDIPTHFSVSAVKLQKKTDMTIPFSKKNVFFDYFIPKRDFAAAFVASTTSFSVVP